MDNLSSGRDTRLGGTEINLPAVVNPTDDLIRTIFGKVADEIGEQLAEDFRRRSSGTISQQERKNLRQHAERVVEQESGPERIKPTRKRIKNIAAWADEAGEHDPNSDRVGSAKWEAILSEIVGGNDQSIIDVLHELNSYDVKALLSLEGCGGNFTSISIQKLLALGVVEKTSAFEDRWFNAVLYMGLLGLLSAAVIPILGTIIFVPAEFYQIFMAFLFLSSIAALSGAGLYWIRRQNMVRFTELGLVIKDKIDWYYSGGKDREVEVVRARDT